MTITLNLATAAKLLNCSEPTPAGTITGAAIDSRQVKQGNIFIAIAGENIALFNSSAIDCSACNCAGLRRCRAIE